MTLLSVIVIGSGPAGHTACMYFGRANLNPLMLEGDSSGPVISGGLLTTTKTVENYAGFADGIDGYQLTSNFRNHSLKYGTEIISETATKVEKLSDGTFKIYTLENDYHSKAIVIATGSTPKRLNIVGYDNFWHKGVSTCAVCDGGLPMFKNVPLAVVGGGDSACEEAEHLSHTAEFVYMIVRGKKLRASKIMCDRVNKNPKIKIIWNTEVDQIIGNKQVEQIVLKNSSTNEKSYLMVKGLFVAIGHTPNTGFLKDFVDLDSDGYIITKRDFSTSVEGVWACGDVQDKKYRQAIYAAGSGCAVALEVERWL